MKATGTEQQLQGWFAGRIPDGWFTQAPTVRVDNDEVLVVGTLPDVDLPADAGDEARATAHRSRIEGFREETRERRMRIADDAQAAFGRKVSWGAECGDTRILFTTASVPVMTRLRMDDRAVLDTLVASGVARSRSHALAWCVRLVGQHQGEWIDELREALTAVDEARAKGPRP
jgi:hypothetical protein